MLASPEKGRGVARMVANRPVLGHFDLFMPVNPPDPCCDHGTLWSYQKAPCGAVALLGTTTVLGAWLLASWG